MHISITDIPVYCLTCEEPDGSKRNHIADQWNQRNIQGEFVQPIIGIAKNKSGSCGFFRMIEKGLRAQIPNTPFRPFLMVEDDVSFQGDLTVDIPDNADIVYAGLSVCSMNSYMFHYANYYDNVEGFPDVVRVKHMLASHGIMICSPLGAAVLQRTMLEVFLSDKAWDIPMALIQPYYNVYAIRRPWVYQDAGYGGDESCTRITFEGEGRSFPEEWKNREFATIKML